MLFLILKKIVNNDYLFFTKLYTSMYVYNVSIILFMKGINKAIN